MKNKLTIIKRGNQYYNAERKTWSERLYLANWYRNRNKAMEVIAYFNLDGAEIIEISEDEYLTAGNDAAARILVALEVTQNYLKESLDIVPGINQDAKHCRNALRNASDKLKFIYNPMKDVYLEHEESADILTGIQDDYLRTISTTDITEMEEITRNIKAWRKDRKSINGLTNKILR